MRTVKMASGATAVQIVYSSRRGARDIEHIGSAHDVAELTVLNAAASSGCPPGRAYSTSAWTPPRRAPAGGPLPITSSRTEHLCDALDHGYGLLGFE